MQTKRAKKKINWRTKLLFFQEKIEKKKNITVQARIRKTFFNNENEFPFPTENYNYGLKGKRRF